MTESDPIDCRLCGRRFSAPVVLVREMMYDTGEEFAYARCPDCRSEMIEAIPADLGPHYPTNYYSLDTWDAPDQTGASARLRRLRLTAVLRFPVPALDWLGIRRHVPHYVRWFAGLGIRPSSAILDLGSGGGHLLTNMAVQGFSNLLGIDPFMQEERRSGPVRLLRAEVDEIAETFEIVMINHTLEHVPDPRALLEAASRRLRPGGHLVVRVPAFDSWAAEHYGTDWVAWDAPRHLQLPTTDGLRTVCEAAELKVVREYRDGHAYAYWGSEQYRIGIPLRGRRSWGEDPSQSPFTAAQIDGWERQARARNAEDRGDAVTFVLALG